jgi:hypothetical protein
VSVELAAPVADDALTPAEIEVLRLNAAGHPWPDFAARIEIQ